MRHAPLALNFSEVNWAEPECKRLTAKKSYAFATSQRLDKGTSLLASFISWSASRQWPFYKSRMQGTFDHNLSLGLSEAAKLPKVTTVGLTKIHLEASKLRCDVFQKLFVCNSNDNKLKIHDLLTNFSISDPVPWRNVALRSRAAKPHSGALPRTSPVHQNVDRKWKTPAHK